MTNTFKPAGEALKSVLAGLKEPEGPKYPKIKVQLSGQDGNAMMIVGRVRVAMRQGGADKADVASFTEEALSGDYDAVLQAAMKYVIPR